MSSVGFGKLMARGHKVVALWLKAGLWNLLFESHVSDNGYVHNRVWQNESALSSALVSGCMGQPLWPMACPLHMVFGLPLVLASFLDILVDLSYSSGPSQLVFLVISVLGGSWFRHMLFFSDHVVLGDCSLFALDLFLVLACWV